ncbi:hypothetical protein F5972_12915 [Microbispora cellulosiformans]|uniref:Uncharacterized protein n=1 Tax=Microbispora cellulosiformans TaxID=2614688 RepID=A0A5J5K405_9ACTN|nr:hypothetical protein [Microbispora cellulosiformans]KAA9379097.1 hypothetical protein F5972_12915 [Microbispora cellulosiformans]
MVIVQRVVIRWAKQARGAAEATRRREIPSAFELPPIPDAPLVIHDVLAEEQTGYAPSSAVSSHALPAQLNGLRFRLSGAAVEVVRTSTLAAYPTNRFPGQVFLLHFGENARYRANFRFSGYSTEWYYEQWTVNIAHGPWHRELFLREEIAYEKDERVSLYGGHR